MNIFDRTRQLAHERLRASYAEDVREPVGLDQTLVIIDMQDGFMNSDDENEIIPAILSLIRLAIQNSYAIIIVEFDKCGDTNYDIIKEVRGYPHRATVIKYDRDGSKKIIDCLDDHPKWSRSLLVCGIYGPECVSETVAGLFDNCDIVEIDVVGDAVVPDYMPGTELDENDNHPERIITVADVVILVEEGGVL